MEIHLIRTSLPIFFLSLISGRKPQGTWCIYSPQTASPYPSNHLNTATWERGHLCVRGGIGGLLTQLSLSRGYESHRNAKPLGWLGPDLITTYSSDLTHLPWTKWPPFRRWYFQRHFHEWKVLYLIKISLKYVPKGPIDNNPALV